MLRKVRSEGEELQSRQMNYLLLSIAGLSLDLAAAEACSKTYFIV
jgi:hypothetical protein